MHVISRKAFREFCEVHEEATESMDALDRQLLRAEWQNFAELRATYPHADLVGEHTMINVGGNKWRVALQFFYGRQVVLVRKVMTHKEYDELYG